MKTITIIVKIDDSEVHRNYGELAIEAKTTEDWGEEVVSMLNNIVSSNEKEF